MKSMKFILCGLFFVLLSISSACGQIIKPEVFEFGKTLAEIKAQVTPLSDSISVRLNEEIQLPTAQKSQSQLDIYGFVFEGKKRNVELIFADDQLDIVWILTEAQEEVEFITAFTKQFGNPTHRLESITFFVNDGAAVRNQPHEVLFISERLKGPYKQWLDSQH